MAILDKIKSMIPWATGNASTKNAAVSQETTGGKEYGGLPIQHRDAINIALDQQAAHLDTMYAFFIDRVAQPSEILKKDPRAIEHMRSDLQIQSCMMLRKLSVSMLKRQWKPAEGDTGGEVAKKIERLYNAQYKPTDLAMNLMEAVFQGCSIVELVWSRNTEGEFYIKRAYHRANDRFVFNKLGQLALKTREDLFMGKAVNYGQGKPLEHPYQFIWHIYNPIGGSWADPEKEAQQFWGRGLMEDIFPTYYSKAVVLGMAEKYLEFTASGKTILYHPQNATQGRESVKAVIETMAAETGIALPSGTTGNFRTWEALFTSGPANPGQAFWEFIQYLDKVIAKYTLGTTMVNDSGNIGTQSSPELQIPTTFGRFNAYDVACMEETHNTMIVPALCDANGIPKELWPKFTYAKNVAMDLLKLAQGLKMLQDMGLELSEENMEEYTGVTGCKEGETPLEPVDTNPNGPGEGAFPGKADAKAGASKAKKKLGSGDKGSSK